MICRSCGNDIKDGVAFCPKCGKPTGGAPSLDATVVANETDAQDATVLANDFEAERTVMADNSFAPESFGAGEMDQTMAANNYAQPNAQPPKKGKGKAIAIVIAVVVVIAAVVAAVFLLKPKGDGANSEESSQKAAGEASVSEMADDKEEIVAKNSTLSEASALADLGDYEGAIKKIKDAQSIYGDDEEYQNAYNTYKEAYKSSILTEADTLAQQESYLEAYNTINDAIGLVGEESDLTAKATEYENKYAVVVIAQIDAYLSADDVTAAKSLMAEALNNAPNNTALKSKNEEVSKIVPKTTIDMISMHTEKSEKYTIVGEEGIVDSYGNTYTTNVIMFDASNNAYVRYDLNGAYQSFSGTVVASNSTGSNANINVGIFADGKLVYSLSNYTRQKPGEKVSLDLTGVRTLEIKTSNNGEYSYGWVFFVESKFVKSGVAVDYVDWSTLTEKTLIDSSRFTPGISLFIDSFGNLHNESYYFDASNNAFAMYNLNKSHTKITGAIATSSTTGSGASMTVSIYCDDKLVLTKSGITKQSAAIDFDIDVSNVQTIKIVTSNQGEYSNGSVYLTDIVLK